MGLLGDFLLGAGGQGLGQVVQNMDARDAQDKNLAARRAEQAAALEERRAEKQAYIDALLEKQRMVSESKDYYTDSRFAGGGAAGGGASGGRGAGGAQSDAYARAKLTEEGMTDPQIDAFLAAKAGTGAKPQRTVEDESGGHAVDDEEGFARMMKSYGTALRQNLAGGNVKHIADANQTEMVTDQARAALAGKNPTAGLLDTARLGGAFKGKGGTDVKDNVTFNEYDPQTQATPATPVGNSVIQKNKAQAGQAGAAATEHIAGADKKRADVSGEGLDRQRKALTDTVDKAQGRMDRLVQGLTGRDADKVRNGPEYAAAKATLERANSDLSAHDTRKTEARTGSPAASNQAAANAVKANFKAGKMTRAEAVKKLQELGFK